MYNEQINDQADQLKGLGLSKTAKIQRNLFS